jgi:hypothetical protein
MVKHMLMAGFLYQLMKATEKELKCHFTVLGSGM